MAKDIFSICATSVPSERLFSQAAMIMTNKKSSLTSDSVKVLLCINAQ
uniref:Dimer_Tnp_hAT domain-containing protein n=1 Tax=Rhodnius prolixus TaxID=13249 RepID=T1HQF0_RHOPR